MTTAKYLDINYEAKFFAKFLRRAVSCLEVETIWCFFAKIFQTAHDSVQTLKTNYVDTVSNILFVCPSIKIILESQLPLADMPW